MILTLAGGVGGAKLVLGLSKLLPARQLAVVVNTGDDISLHGLRICPDLDTVTYTLAGVVDPQKGWGMADDSFRCLEALSRLGADTWFRLGDRDLATHLRRTQLLADGSTLTEATGVIRRSLGVQSEVLPMSDGFHPTRLETDSGPLHLQEYLVREGCRPAIRRIIHSHIEGSSVPEAAAAAIKRATAVIVCPSNPFISIGPILAVGGFRAMLESSPARVVAVSPIVGGRALKGPAAKMLRELGHPVSALSVARLYRGLVGRFVLDRLDSGLAGEVEALGMEVQIADTVMNSVEQKQRLASEILQRL